MIGRPAAVDVVVPVYRRPHRAAPFMDSLYATAGRDEVTLVAVATPGDTDTIAAWAAGGLVLMAPEPPGSFAQKCNHAWRHTEGDWTLFVGDDVRFHPGWLPAAMEVAAETGAAVVGTNDLGAPRVQAGEHATHLLIARDYVRDVGASWDGPGIVAHEGFRHQFVDDEQVLAAKRRGVWAFAANSVIEHLHPAFGKAPSDGTYEIGAAAGAADAALFEQRRARYAAEATG